MLSVVHESMLDKPIESYRVLICVRDVYLEPLSDKCHEGLNRDLVTVWRDVRMQIVETFFVDHVDDLVEEFNLLDGVA